MAKATDAPATQSRGITAIVALLALAIFINALDRGNFSTATPLIKTDLNLSNSQIGVLISAFFWTYVPGHVLAGWLVDRIDAYRVLTLGLATWSLATFLTGFAGGFVSILILRLILGAGESVGFPASSSLLARLVPAERLASANAWTGVGLMMGNGAGVFIGGMLLATYGWPALFFFFGALSLLWLVPWSLVKRPPLLDEGQTAAAVPAPGLAELLGKREMWGAMLGHFCGNYSYFLVLSWLPLFLVRQHGFSITTMAWLGGAVYLIASLTGLLGARLTDRLIAGGGDASRVRKSVILIAGFIGLCCMLACASGSPSLAVAGLLFYGLANGLAFFSIFSIGQTLAGPRAAGKWVGLQNGCGGLAGLTSPLVTGYSIDATGDYRVAFLIAAMVCLLGMVCWGIVIRRIAPVKWSAAPQAAVSE